MAGVRVTLMYDIELEPGVKAEEGSHVVVATMERVGDSVDHRAWPSPTHHLATTRLVMHESVTR